MTSHRLVALLRKGMGPGHMWADIHIKEKSPKRLSDWVPENDPEYDEKIEFIGSRITDISFERVGNKTKGSPDSKIYRLQIVAAGFGAIDLPPVKREDLSRLLGLSRRVTIG